MADKKGFFAEFREFALKGNVIDLAVGVIVGGAFTSITNSLINDVIMPFIGMFLGGVDFSSWVLSLPNLYGGDPIPLNIGVFINTVINFLVLAFVVFLMVKAINKARSIHEKPAPEPEPAPEPDPEPTKEELLLTEIRDLLKNK